MVSLIPANGSHVYIFHEEDAKPFIELVLFEKKFWPIR